MIISCNRHAHAQFRQSYLGPDLPNSLSRKYLSYSSNQAPAYIPDALINSNYIRNTHNGAKVEDYVLKPTATPELLDILSKDIQNHVEARIQSFLYQMILTYKTGIQFILCTHAELQVGEVKSRAGSGGSYAAAHSGTLTTLRIANNRSDNTSTAFGKDSYFYYTWNITVYLPTLVNQVDIKLDSSTRYCSDGKNFRSKATKTLNSVSIGSLDPLTGLKTFLQEMIAILNEASRLERDAKALKVLRIYSEIAEGYQKKISDGYPIVQKLFFRSTTDTISDLFYLAVQADIHSQFKTEMQLLMPKQELPATVAVNFDISPLQVEVVKRLSLLLPLQPKTPSKKESVTEEYIKCSILSNKVETLAKAYFNHLLSLSLADRIVDLDKLTKIRTNKTIKSIALSAPAFSLHQAVLEEIKKDPQKMPLILFTILARFLVKISQSQTAAPLQLSPEGREYLTALIENRIAQANIGISKSSTAYATECSRENRIRALAYTFFTELAIINNEMLIASEIDKILSIKTEKTLPQNLPETVIALNSEALAIIRSKKTKNEAFTPRQIGLILCKILIDTLRTCSESSIG